MQLHLIDATLASTPRVNNSELLRAICDANIRLYPNAQPVLPWAGYLAEEGGELVGTCAFKSPPVAGSVEIAYFTFPGFERRGVASRMAQQLVAMAREHGIARVRAQTLPEQNASTRILRKLGFTLVGPVMHPEDGQVWEWHLADHRGGAGRVG